MPYHQIHYTLQPFKTHADVLIMSFTSAFHVYLDIHISLKNLKLI